MIPDSPTSEPRAALITGSSSGVGAATARLLARRGWNVVVNYRSNAEGARSVEADCRDAGAEVAVVQADVGDDADCRALVAVAEERWGRLDALVNNAGMTKFCRQDDLDGLTKDDFLRIYSVNVVGPYQMIRAAEPLLRASGGGSVVNVASMAGINGIGSSTAYAASKGALNTMTLSLSRVLGPEIRINAVCPGFIQGDWLRDGLGEEVYEQVRKAREDSAALRMTVTPELVADAIAWLVEGAAGTTGELVKVDGGHHLAGHSITRA